MSVEIRFGADSHRGAVRNHNEDAFFAESGDALWLVADGIGGAEGGALASSIAVNSIESGVATGLGLAEAIQKAHEEIILASAQKESLSGMGTTIAALRFDDGDYQIAWVGDSRVYLLRENELIQLTHDHSLVQLMVDRGDISPEEAESHPRRNIITRSLGSAGTGRVDVDTVGGEVCAEDTFLLCSDGLNGELNDALILEIMLRMQDEPADAAKALVRRAVAAGGRDNVTAVVVAVREG